MNKHFWGILLAFTIGIIGLTAQNKRVVQTNRNISRPKVEESTTASADIPTSEKQNDFNIFLNSILNNAFVIFRQDYNLIDEEEGYIREVQGRNYWGREYSLGARIGEAEFLISGETMRPWSKEGISKNARYQPQLSNSAIRGLNAPAFEIIEFDADNVIELREKRLYVTGGSEEPGLTAVGLLGYTTGYAVWAVPDSTISDNHDLSAVALKFTPLSVNFMEGRGLYDCSPIEPDATIGGFYLVPIKLHPGCVDFCIAGMFQKIGGIWKLVSITEGTEYKLSAYSPFENDFILATMSHMGDSLKEFLEEVGL